MRGVGLGIAGAFAKPLSGFAGFASKVTEGVGAEARKLTPRALEAATMGPLLRVRQPRMLYDGVLRPYQRNPPLILVDAVDLDVSDRVVELPEQEDGGVQSDLT